MFYLILNGWWMVWDQGGWVGPTAASFAITTRLPGFRLEIDWEAMHPGAHAIMGETKGEAYLAQGYWRGHMPI